MSDMLLGAIVLVPFLAFIFVAGYFIYQFKNRQLTSAWGPLVGLVNGKVVGDGGGGASSWLSGTFQGRPVVAKLAPNPNQRYPLLLRDYLRARPHAAAAIDRVKRAIAAHHPDDIEAYYDIKDPVYDVIWDAAQGWAAETRRDGP